MQHTCQNLHQAQTEAPDPMQQTQDIFLSTALTSTQKEKVPIWYAQQNGQRHSQCYYLPCQSAGQT
jgi:hypothetical protein